MLAGVVEQKTSLLDELNRRISRELAGSQSFVPSVSLANAPNHFAEPDLEVLNVQVYAPMLRLLSEHDLQFRSERFARWERFRTYWSYVKTMQCEIQSAVNEWPKELSGSRLTVEQICDSEAVMRRSFLRFKLAGVLFLLNVGIAHVVAEDAFANLVQVFSSCAEPLLI
jgi:hypothetical protein